MSIVRTDAEFQTLMDEIVSVAGTRPVRIGFINAHAINLCYRNPAFLQDLLACEYLLRDGSGVKILFKMLGRDPGINLAGTDSIPSMITRYTGRRIALMGTQSPWLDRAGEVITRGGGQIVAMLDGFQDEGVYKTLAAQTHPDLIILGMGMPKQEKVAAHLTRAPAQPCLMICGGAMLDFMGEKVTRAPLIFRKMGMEWVYRLAREPKRLFARYVLGNALFLYRAYRLSREAKEIEKRTMGPKD